MSERAREIAQEWAKQWGISQAWEIASEITKVDKNELWVWVASELSMMALAELRTDWSEAK